MSVGTYALTSVAEALAYIGEDVQRDALWLYFTGTSGTNTVQVNDTTLVLIDVDNGTTTKTFANATDDTLTEIVATINAVAGWEAGLIYHGSADTANLIITGALNAEGAANEQTLKIRDVYLIERLIDRATDLIERYCQRKFVSRDYSREIYYGTGEGHLLLDQYPVTRVSRLSSSRSNALSILNSSTDCNFTTVEVTATTIRLIVSGGANADDTALTLATYSTIDALITAIEALAKGWSCTALASDTSSRDASELLIRPSMYVGTSISAYIEIVDDDITEYKLVSPGDEDRNYGVIERPSVFMDGTEYFCNYTAGFTTTPAALEMACIELVKYKYDQGKQTSGLKSEMIGNIYSYEKFALADLKNGLPPDLMAELDLYRRREF